MSLIVRGGHVVGPGGLCRADVLMEDGIVQALSRRGTPSGRVVDASGCLVFPGLIDTHVHMGFEAGGVLSTDDFASGSRAAAFGGVTTLIDYALPTRGEALAAALHSRRAAAEGRCHVDYGLHVILPPYRYNQPVEIAQCLETGATSFKLFTIYPDLRLGAGELFEAMSWIVRAGGLALVHAEDAEFVESRTRVLVEQGATGADGHLASRPAVAEAMAVARVLHLQAETGCPVHFVHISSGTAAQLIGEAKARGADVSWETCPHYLVLDAEVYRRADGHRYLVSPPIKTREDRAALWAALQGGELDTVATDHCPFTAAQKDAGRDDFTRVPTGLPGVETTLPLLYTEWQDRGLDLGRLAVVTSQTPAQRFGLYPRKGIVAPGSDADLVVYDPGTRGVIRAEALHMNVDWSPYEGRSYRGSVRAVVSRGRVLIEDGTWCGEEPGGTYLPRGSAVRAVAQGG